MIEEAEGVENLEQLTILLDMKCQFGQGYLFSKPISKEAVNALINEMQQYALKNPGLSYPLTDELSN
jgi:EAL domain-containing protein (putative c-di-GMP-specific phosphodiesterase class I)